MTATKSNNLMPLLDEGQTHQLGQKSLVYYTSTVAAVYAAGYGGQLLNIETYSDEQLPVRVAYAATGIAIAFALVLEIIVSINSTMKDKKQMSTMFAYCHAIMSLNYLISAFAPWPVAGDHGHNMLRSIEWLFGAPIFIYWFSTSINAKKAELHSLKQLEQISVALAICSVVFSSFSAGLKIAEGVVMAVMLRKMFSLAANVSSDSQESQSLSLKTIKLMCWHIGASWSLYPCIYALHSFGFIGAVSSEFALCFTDYLFQVGLTMLVISFSIDDVNAERAQQLRLLVCDMLHTVRKTCFMKTALGSVNEDVRAWLMIKYEEMKINSDLKPHTDASGERAAESTEEEEPQSQSVLHDWDYNAAAQEYKDLEEHCYAMFKSIKVFDKFSISEEKMRSFISAVKQQYHGNSFHNFEHATMVLHATHMMSHTLDQTILSDLEKLALYVAALCHDIDHHGVNNAFHVNSRSQLAIRYNDKSVMESHHAACAFEIILEPSINILSNLSEDELKRFRKLVVDCVLATDMGEHGAKLKRMEKFIEDGGLNQELNDDSRGLILELIIHSADLHNPFKNFNINKQWARRLQREFNEQVKMEEQLGLPSLPFMKGSDDMSLAKGEIGFISFVIKPWYTQFANAFPDFTFLVDRIDKNVKNWKSVIEALEVATAREQ